jgi:hypothetical protein
MQALLCMVARELGKGEVGTQYRALPFGMCRHLVQ